VLSTRDCISLSFGDVRSAVEKIMNPGQMMSPIVVRICPDGDPSFRKRTREFNVDTEVKERGCGLVAAFVSTSLAAARK
jgi:hypothetical protein